MVRNTCTARSTFAARPATTGRSSTAAASGRAGGSERSPVLDMMEVRLSTRVGWAMAMACAIIGSGHNVCATHWRPHATEELVAFFPEGCATTAPPGTPMGLVAARDLEARYPARSGLVGPLPRSEKRRGLCVQDGPRRRASEPTRNPRLGADGQSRRRDPL